MTKCFKCKKRKRHDTSYCKVCRRKYNRNWNLLNSEHVREYRSTKKFKARTKKYFKKYYRANKKKISIKNKKWQLKNKERVAELQRNWRNDNKERAKQHRRNWYLKNRKKISKLNKERYLKGKGK